MITSGSSGDALPFPGDPNGDAPSRPMSPERIQALLRGDADAWEEFVERYGPWLRRLVSGRIPDGVRGRFDTEDVYNSGLARIFSHLEAVEFVDEARFRAWLKQVMISRLVERRRHAGRRRRDPDSETPSDFEAHARDDWAEETPSHHVSNAEMLARLVEAMPILGPMERKLLYHRFAEGRPWKDIAAELGCSQRAAQRRLGAAIEQLSRAVHAP